MDSFARPRRPYRVVADQISALIASAGLRPGDRLPSERDLAEQLSLSRPSLREALIALEVEGRVAIRMGSGIYVSEVRPDLPPDLDPFDGDGPIELLQARCIIEAGIAEEAARHSSPALIATLDDVLAQMTGAIPERARVIALDRAFHMAIAEACGNAILTNVCSAIFDRRMTPIFEQFSRHFERPRSWRLAVGEHGGIRDALAAADPAAAREAMSRHLTASFTRFTDSLLAEPVEGADPQANHA